MLMRSWRGKRFQRIRIMSAYRCGCARTEASPYTFAHEWEHPEDFFWRFPKQRILEPDTAEALDRPLSHILPCRECIYLFWAESPWEPELK